MHSIDQLSTDVLTEIFSLTCRTDFSKDVVGNISPLDLGAVCTSWRHLVWTTPSLWRYIYVKVSPDRYKAQAALLEDWLGRTGSGPLDVVFRVVAESIQADRHEGASYSRNYHEEPYVETVLEPLLREFSRWRTLELDISTPKICTRIDDMPADDNFGRLRKLRVRVLCDPYVNRYAQDNQHGFCFRGRAPLLTHLVVEEHTSSGFILRDLEPESQAPLASLSLHGCSDALKWIRRYGNTIRHLRLKSITNPSIYGTQPRLTLKSLQSVNIVPDSKGAEFLARYSSGSMLQKLAIPLPGSNASSLDYMDHLFSWGRIQVLRLRLPLWYDPDLSTGGTENRVADLLTRLRLHSDTLIELALEVGHLGGGNGYFVDRFHEALGNDLQALPKLASYDFRILRASPHGSRDWLWTRMNPVRQVIKSWCDDRRVGLQLGERLNFCVSLPDIERERTKQVLEQEIRDGVQVNFTDPFQGYSRPSVEWHLLD